MGRSCRVNWRNSGGGLENFASRKLFLVSIRFAKGFDKGVLELFLPSLEVVHILANIFHFSLDARDIASNLDNFDRQPPGQSYIVPV